MAGDIFDLSGKVALVTGGGSGLGRVFCEAMAEFGADVVCTDIIEEKAQETVELISRFNHRAIAVKSDASDEDDVKSLVKQTVEELDTIDIVFANAGKDEKRYVPIHEETLEEWDEVMSFQPRSVFLLMRAVFPIMMKQRSGSFICTASIGGLTPTSCKGPFSYLQSYNSSKAAVIALSKIAAKQYGEYGIRVNAICPGYHRTPMINTETISIREEQTIALTPLNRVGMPEELKGLAVWLASDASSFVTGQVIVQDGGMIT